MDTKTCSSCRYWDNENIKDYDSDEPDIGECTRFPPILLVTKPMAFSVGLKIARKLERITRFPVTSCRITCGEWKRAE